MQEAVRELATGSVFAGRYQVIEELGRAEGTYFLTIANALGTSARNGRPA